MIYRRGQPKKSPSIEQKNVSTAVEHELFFFFNDEKKKANVKAQPPSLLREAGGDK